MSHALNCTEIEGQYVEMLPARTVLSLIDLLEIGKGDEHAVHGRPGTNVTSHVEGKVYQHPEGIHD